ncbi:FecR family protein [Chitinophaga caseinilytica]|uniref:FecR domain-containing protein n=1 Tax=Chitinophaga caseinilytica TaxID=2267521 RepID=A0ABZ2ZBJ2_9BACT
MTAEQQRIDILLARHMAGEITPAEREELQQLLKGHADTAFVMEVLNAVQTVTTGRDPELADPDVWAERSWSSLEAAMNAPAAPAAPQEAAPVAKVRRMRPWYYAAAAVIAVAVALPFLFRDKAAISHAAQRNIVIAKGERTSLSLPDGTKVWVNGGSKLSYGEAFGSSNREVCLEGEACFEVAPDEKRPFVVRTGNMDVRVLGTRFNIKAYPEDGQVQAVLLNGKVKLTLRNTAGGQEKDMLLAPGQKVTLGTVAGEGVADRELQLPLEVGAVNPADCDEIAWINDRLVFRDVPFRALARDMERWYDVKIHLEDAALGKELFSGVFDKQDINEALKALQIATPFTYTRNGADVYIRR